MGLILINNNKNKLKESQLKEFSHLQNEIESLYKILKLNYAFPCGLILPEIMHEDVGKIVCQMKKQGRPIFCETTTAAVALSGNKYFSTNWEEAAAIITEPPLRNDQGLFDISVH